MKLMIYIISMILNLFILISVLTVLSCSIVLGVPFDEIMLIFVIILIYTINNIILTIHLYERDKYD